MLQIIKKTLFNIFQYLNPFKNKIYFESVQSTLTFNHYQMPNETYIKEQLIYALMKSKALTDNIHITKTVSDDKLTYQYTATLGIKVDTPPK